MRVRLSELKPGEAAVIEDVALPEGERQLLMRFGFFDGAEVRCSRRAPLGDPVIYSLDGSESRLAHGNGWCRHRFQHRNYAKPEIRRPIVKGC